MYKRYGIMASLLLLHIAGCAGLGSSTASMPENLKPGENERLAFVAPASSNSAMRRFKRLTIFILPSINRIVFGALQG